MTKLVGGRGKFVGPDRAVAQNSELARQARELTFSRLLVPTQLLTAAKLRGGSEFSLALDDAARCDPTGGAFQVRLPKADGNAGRMVAVINDSASATAITIASISGETVNGATSIALAAARTTKLLMSTGDSWVTLV